MDTTQAKHKYAQAGTLFKQGKYGEALLLLNELAEAYPASPDVLHARAMVLVQIGKTAEAAELCDRLAEELHDPRGKRLKAELETRPGTAPKTGLNRRSLLISTAVGVGVVVLVVTGLSVVVAMLRHDNGDRKLPSQSESRRIIQGAPLSSSAGESLSAKLLAFRHELEQGNLKAAEEMTDEDNLLAQEIRKNPDLLVLYNEVSTRKTREIEMGCRPVSELDGPQLFAALAAKDITQVREITSHFLPDGSLRDVRNEEGLSPLLSVALTGDWNFWMQAAALLQFGGRERNDVFAFEDSSFGEQGRLMVRIVGIPRFTTQEAKWKNPSGLTYLHIAAHLGNGVACHGLLAAGADPNAADATGSTPLHAAAKHGAKGAVLMLLAGGANPSVKDNEGRTPQDVARAGDQMEIVGVLENPEATLGNLPERLLRFPRDFSKAQMLVRAPGDSELPSRINPEGGSLVGIFGDSWTLLSPAAGEVSIPRGMEARINLDFYDKDSQPDVSCLSKLGPNDVQYIGSGEGEKVYPEYRTPKMFLRHITHLTGLRELRLDWNFEYLEDSDGQFLGQLKGLRILAAGNRFLDDQLDSKDLPYHGFSHRVLNDLAGLEALEELDLSGHRISGPGFEFIGRLTTLKKLNLAGTGITDDDLRFLAPLQSLDDLNLGGNPITDEGLGVLSKLDSLRSLDLSGCGKIKGMGLAHLAGLAHFERLALGGDYRLPKANLSGCVRHIGQLKGLKELTSFSAGVTDSDLEHLTALNSLERLYLGSEPITDKGLRILARTKSLKELTVSNSKTTEAGRAELANALPGCKVKFQ